MIVRILLLRIRERGGGKYVIVCKNHYTIRAMYIVSVSLSVYIRIARVITERVHTGSRSTHAYTYMLFYKSYYNT